jgi:hypothetical protein
MLVTAPAPAQWVEFEDQTDSRIVAADGPAEPENLGPDLGPDDSLAE